MRTSIPVIVEKRQAPQQRGQILAVHVFHRQPGGAFGFADIVHAADIGMRDLPRDAHFVAEPRARSLVRRLIGAGLNIRATVWPSTRSLAR